jgi:hypothetical protein
MSLSEEIYQLMKATQPQERGFFRKAHKLDPFWEAKILLDATQPKERQIIKSKTKSKTK